MASKVIGLDGRPVGETERIEPKMLLDASDGKFSIPVVVLTDFQYRALVDEITASVVQAITGDVPAPKGEVVEGQLELPIDGNYVTV